MKQLRRIAIALLVVQLVSMGACQIMKQVTAQPLPQARVTQTFADVTVTAAATLIRAGNSSRMALSCKNTHATVAIRVGDSNITAERGLQINGGETFVVTNTDAVYGVSTGASVVVACTESLR